MDGDDDDDLMFSLPSLLKTESFMIQGCFLVRMKSVQSHFMQN